jgi:hypothetical protein
LVELGFEINIVCPPVVVLCAVPYAVLPKALTFAFVVVFVGVVYVL